MQPNGRHDAWPHEGAATASLLPVQAAHTRRFASELNNDGLALVFSACHPALPINSQVALALEALTDLDLATITADLLFSDAALAALTLALTAACCA